MMKLINNTIKKLIMVTSFALLSVWCAFSQQITVTGTVTDGATSEPLIGVNIIIDGTTSGVVTDINGAYSINVPGSDAVLAFSYIGYNAEKIAVGAQTKIDVQLIPDITSLDEVVFVGYGYKKKSDLTGSVASVSAEDLAVRPVARIDQALQSQAAGVQVTSTGGMPGQGMSIRVRGHGSLGTSNGPLWVIDGYAGGDINSVSPEDIEHIEILKDASSTAIYGARGGNGVILVTTKRGSQGQDRIDFSYYHQVSNVEKRMDLLNTEEYTTLRNRALTEVGLEELFTPGQIAGTEPIQDYIADTDWQDEIFQTAHTNYYNLSFSGGSEKTKYALSINHRDQEGIIIDSKYKRNGIRLNVDHEFNKKIKIGANVSGYRTEQDRFNVGGGWAFGAAGAALSSFPYYPVYDEEGEIFNLDTWDNPVLQALGQEQNNIRTGVQGNFFFEYKPIKDLTLKADFAGTYRTDENSEFITARLFGATETRRKARASIGNGTTDRWVGNATATYERTFFDIHQFKFLVGIEQQVRNYKSNYMFGEEIDRESFMWYNMGAYLKDNRKISSNANGDVYQSVFGRLNYNLLDRYLLEATIRRDGSSKFGPSEKWGNFPSFSAAWKVSNEEFLQSFSRLYNLKVRFSWGQSGNDNISLYQWISTMSVGGNSYVFGGVGSSAGDAVVPGAIYGRIPNESVHWETSTIADLGIDLGFYNNRLRFTLDLYNRQTKELLWDKDLPLYTGYGGGWSIGQGVTVKSNVAEMNNKGIELLVGADIMDRGDFRWSMDVNYSKNINEVVSLADDSEFFTGHTKVEPGQPIGNLWGFYTDGIFQEGDDVENTPRFTGDEGVGDQRYIDANNNGVLNDEDRGIIGNALPDYLVGVINTFSYKNFELHTIINGVFGNDMYNGSRQLLSDGTLGENNGGSWLLNAWTPENTNTDIPKMSDNYVDKTSDRFVEDASFVRVANIQLTYNMPQSVLSTIKMKSLSVYVSLQNFFTFTNYTGYDPEAHSGGDSNLNLGYDSQNYPAYKSATFGIKLGL